MKPTCVKCQIGMRNIEGNVPCFEMFLNPPQPYKIYLADKYRCPICGYEILTGYGAALVEHYMVDFQDTLLRLEDHAVIQYERVADSPCHKED